jgi:2-polyprenyl-3-methyl-5-hydroxy-6-metoxy-1,4-benzoquinol methylase
LYHKKTKYNEYTEEKMNDRLIGFYNNYDEENRLVKDNFHRIEYVTNIHYIEKYCPQNSVILDACAGTGRYAFHLARNEHKVTTGDIVPSHVEYIKSKNKGTPLLAGIKINNVLGMDFQDNSFDVVLCMGALYHLKTKDEQHKAINECTRILKAKGIIILSYINKHAQMLLDVKKGGRYFKEAYNNYKGKGENIFIGTSPKEIKELTRKNNIKEIKNIGSDGLAYLLTEEINKATEEEFETWLKYHLETCEEGSILGNSLHGLYVGEIKR